MAALLYTDRISQRSQHMKNYNLLSSQFGDGYEQVAPSGMNYIRNDWQIVYENMTLTERNALIAFVDNAVINPFQWTAPGSVTSANFRITPDSFAETMQSGNLYTISFKAKQVFY